MTRFNAWNVFKNGLNGQIGWSRQWRDPEPKENYEVVIVGGGLHGLATAYYLAKNHNIKNIAVLENIAPPFPRITYDEAVKILKENGSDFEYGNDFGAPDETVLSSQFDKPIMIHRWPANIKPFYMKRDRDNIELALGVDMIAPEGYGEIVGGGQREDDLDILTKSIRHHDLPLEPFQWFLDLRKYGSVPHSGFGLGLERVVAWICGTKHIRETIPFPRTMARLEP